MMISHIAPRTRYAGERSTNIKTCRERGVSVKCEYEVDEV